MRLRSSRPSIRESPSNSLPTSRNSHGRWRKKASASNSNSQKNPQRSSFGQSSPCIQELLRTRSTFAQRGRVGFGGLRLTRGDGFLRREQPLESTIHIEKRHYQILLIRAGERDSRPHEVRHKRR